MHHRQFLTMNEKLYRTARRAGHADIAQCELQLRPAATLRTAVDAPRMQATTVAAQPNGGLTIPWTAPYPTAIKGVVHVPAHNTPMTPSRRDALLIAIAKARAWVEDLAHGRAASFAAIARREGKAERHVRLLAPLAFVSPRIVAAILDGTAPEVSPPRRWPVRCLVVGRARAAADGIRAPSRLPPWTEHACADLRPEPASGSLLSPRQRR